MQHEKERRKKIKSLSKQIFEKQIIKELRQFSNGVMSALDEQNKILVYLVAMQGFTHTSFPTM